MLDRSGSCWPSRCAVAVVAAWMALVWPVVPARQGLAVSQELAGPSAVAPDPADAGDADPLGGPSPLPVRVNEEAGINFLSLMVKGGWFMLPIGLLSLLVVTIAIERSLALRRGRVLPAGLVTELGRLGGGRGTFDPREAYRICQQFPSSAASVVRAMLLKVGRPHSEVEHTVAEASEREAERLYSNARWLNLAAAVAPLLGLLGTVWGMIDAFHRTTQLGPGQNKAEELATGIYIALVTTFGGLMVAIPAAIFAHFFEGKIQRLFHQIDELLFSLLPQIERFEGRMRFGHPSGDGKPEAEGGGESEPVAPPRRQV